MWHKRWVWRLRDTRNCEMVLGIILESRMREGFVPISTGIYTFFKEIMLLASRLEDEKEMRTYVPASIQYLTFLMQPSTLVLEVWMEPQRGVHIPKDSANGSVYTESQVFDELVAWFSETDTHVIASLATFNYLGTVINANPTRNISLSPPIVHDESRLTPPLSLDSLTLFGGCVDERYPMLLISNTGEHSADSLLANSRLYDMLASAIHRVSSYEVNAPNDSRFKGGRFFVKVCVPARLMLAFLHPLSREPERDFVVSFYDITLESFGPAPHSPSLLKSIGSLFGRPVVSIAHTSPSFEDDEGEDESDEEYENEDMMTNSLGGTKSASHMQAINQYIEASREGYNISLAHAVFASVREGIRISPEDVKRTLSTLYEYPLDVDVTQFLQILQQNAENNYEIVQSRFAQQLANNFLALSQCENYYYHQQSTATHPTPEALQKCAELAYIDDDADGSNADFEDLPSADFDERDDAVVFQQENPILFMRMEAVLIHGNSNEYHTQHVFTVNAMPTPQNMRVPDTPPTHAILRFVCLTLPHKSRHMRGFSPPHSETVGKGLVRDLPHEILPIIRDHRRRIAAFLSSEILESLRTAKHITQPVLDIVAHHLNGLPALPLNSTPYHLHRTELSLLFIDKREGPKQFARELESSPLLPLQKCGDLYFAVKKAEGGSSPPLEYWLALWLQDQSVKITLFSSLSSECGQIFLRMRHTLYEISKRVNQLLLLWQMHEMKTCSILLTLPDDKDKDKEKSKEREREKALHSGKYAPFYPGQFACPLVHTITFPLHERVQPASLASRALVSSALHPFSVTNRKNLFVYREKSGHVYYLRLSESGGDVSPAPSPYTSPAPSPHSSPAPSPSLFPHSLSAIGIARLSFITLDVYGVDPVSPEITQQLHQLLENKLVAITLSIISNFIMRNPLLKLTVEDVDFIRPPGTPPKTFFIDIPPFVGHPYQFLLFVRQNFLQFLQLVHLSPAAQYREDLLGVGEIDNLDEIDKEKVFEIRQSDFTFIYNHVTPLPTPPAFSAIGQGIACVSVSLLDEKQDRLTHVSRKFVGDLVPIDDCLRMCQQPPTVDGPSEEPLTRCGRGSWSKLLALQLWARGPINSVALVDKLILSIHQTICEYTLENYILNGPVIQGQLGTFLEISEKMLSRCRTLSVPSVTESSVALGYTAGGLPSWAVDSFLVELAAILYDINPHVDHSIHFCHNVAASPPVYVPYQLERTNSSIKNCNDTNESNNPNVNSSPNNSTSGVTIWNKQNTAFAIIGGKAVLCDTIDNAPNPNIIESDTPLSPQQTTPSTPLPEPTLPAQMPLPTEGIAFYPIIKDPQYNDHVPRCRYIILNLNSCQQMSLYTYNWAPSRMEQFNSLLSKLQALVAMRMHLLNNILHQKLGLFQHTAPLSVTGTNNAGAVASSTTGIVKLTWDSFEALLTGRDTSLSSKGTENRKKSAAATAVSNQPRARSRSATHAPDINNIFRDNYPSTPLHSKPQLSNIADPVSRHALQAKALSNFIEKKAASRAAAAARINSISTKVGSSTPSSISYASAATILQLDAIAGMSRLLHFRSVPFLFADPHLPYADCKECQGGRQAMLNVFSAEYIQYVTTFGAHQLVPKERDSHSASNNNNIDSRTGDIKPVGSNTRVYLQKVFLDGGMLLIRVDFRDIHVTCEIFVVPKPSYDPGVERLDNSIGNTKNRLTHPTQSAKLFAEECGKFTGLLHLNSFSYDFHLHQLYILINCQNLSAHPQPRTIFEITRSLHQYYPVPPAHASSLLHFLELTIPMPTETPADVFSFMAANAGQYGLQVLPNHDPELRENSGENLGQVNKTYSKTSHPHDNQAVLFLPLGEGPTEVWLAVLTAASEQIEGQLATNAYVLKFSTNRFSGFTSSGGIENNQIASRIEDYVARVQHRVQASLRAAHIHYERDMLWGRLVRGNPYEPSLDMTEFQTLMSLIYSRSVVEIDPGLLSPVNIFSLTSAWPSILTHLAQVCGDKVRQFHDDPVRRIPQN